MTSTRNSFGLACAVLAAVALLVRPAGAQDHPSIAPAADTKATDAKPADAEVKPTGQKQSMGVPGPDEDVVAIDSNGDGKPDIFKFYQKGKAPTDPNKPDTGGPLLRKEADLNGDGKIDVWTWYNPDGGRLREAFDLDFDGKVDVVVFYEKAQVVRKEYYSACHDRPDTFKYYEKQKLVRVERDRKCSGRIDTWEYWDGDHIDRIGEDNDGDGNVDRWIKPGKKS
jgi:hypothetical protein